jgi:hypothetical protein
MLITGTFKKKTPLVEYGKQGKKKGGLLISVGDFDKAKLVHFTVFEKTYSSFDAKDGDEITVDFNIESREWEGKYYTDAIAWSIIPVMVNKSQQQPTSAKNATPVNQDTFKVADNAGGIEDDLPFALFIVATIGSLMQFAI